VTEGEFHDIDRRLQRLETKVDLIVETVTRQAAICAPSRTRLEGVCKTIYGNGHDGLASRLAHLEAIRRVGSSVVAGVVGLLSGAMLTVLAWFLNK